MGKIVKRKFFLAFLLSFISLYLIGDLKSIQADIRAFGNSLFELLLLHLFLFSTNIVFMYKILVILSKRSHTTDLLVIISGLIAMIFIQFTLNSPFNGNLYANMSPHYIGIGDYLRDQHGINWYFMDWGGWVITVILYLLPIYMYVIYRFIKFVFHTKIRD